MKSHYEEDASFTMGAYRVDGHGSVAWYVLGWETVPVRHTERTGIEERTGKVVAVMIGDDSHFTFYPEELHALDHKEYCSVCGQIGCGHDGYDREEARDDHYRM